jgi:hypothetical protein
MPKSVTWDREFYFPSEGRHAVDIFGRVRTRELGYQKPLDHRSRSNTDGNQTLCVQLCAEFNGKV